MATKKNTMTLELYHAWSKAKKNWYNKEYYKKNRDKWLGEGGYVDQLKEAHARVTLDIARRNHELGDNKDLGLKAYGRAASLSDDARRLRAGEWNYERLYGKDAKNPYTDDRKEYERRANAAEGDLARYDAMARIGDKMHKQPQAMMKTKSSIKDLPEGIKFTVKTLAKRTVNAADAIKSEAKDHGERLYLKLKNMVI